MTATVDAIEAGRARSAGRGTYGCHLRWALDSGGLEAAQELAEGLWRFWSLEGHLTEGRAWLRQVLERLPDERGAQVMAAAPVGP